MVYAEMFHHAIEIGTNDALQDFAVNITYNGKTVPLTKQFPTEKILNIIIGDLTEVDQVSTEDAVNLFLLRG